MDVHDRTLLVFNEPLLIMENTKMYFIIFRKKKETSQHELRDYIPNLYRDAGIITGSGDNFLSDLSEQSDYIRLRLIWIG